MLKEPIFIENSKVPIILSKFAPIEISAITLGIVVFSRGVLSERVKRHETIHYKQYLETLFVGFLLVYLYDYLYSAFVLGMGFSREAYLNIRFEQEAYGNDHSKLYLKNRSSYSWLEYPLDH
tara:strand:+ start:121 stop:486 length:366 start_codon:yes stop_codon:yes gene_type:complete